MRRNITRLRKPVKQTLRENNTGWQFTSVAASSSLDARRVFSVADTHQSVRASFPCVRVEREVRRE